MRRHSVSGHVATFGRCPLYPRKLLRLLLIGASALGQKQTSCRAVNRNRLEFFGIELDVLALGDLVTLDDVLLRNFITGPGIDLAIPDPVAGLLVELVEADLFALRRRRKQRNRTRDERELQITFPVRTRGHSTTPTQQFFVGDNANLGIDPQELKRLG